MCGPAATVRRRSSKQCRYRLVSEERLMKYLWRSPLVPGQRRERAADHKARQHEEDAERIECAAVRPFTGQNEGRQENAPARATGHDELCEPRLPVLSQSLTRRPRPDSSLRLVGADAFAEELVVGFAQSGRRVVVEEGQEGVAP